MMVRHRPRERSLAQDLEQTMSQSEQATPSSEPEWMTTGGLSKMLGGIPVSTIRGWRLAGIGPPYVRLGGHVRYRRPDVERWIAAGGDRRSTTRQR